MTLFPNKKKIIYLTNKKIIPRSSTDNPEFTLQPSIKIEKFKFYPSLAEQNIIQNRLPLATPSMRPSLPPSLHPTQKQAPN